MIPSSSCSVTELLSTRIVVGDELELCDKLELWKEVGVRFGHINVRRLY